MTSRIESDLISNKTNCYIFDIDNCIAESDHIILNKKNAYLKETLEYAEKLKQYQIDKERYNEEIEKYEQGEIITRPQYPVEPIRPSSPDPETENDFAREYFDSHLKECYPIYGVLDIFIALALSKKVILLTSRNESTRDDTIEWLRKVIVERTSEDTYRRINFQLVCKSPKCNKNDIIFKKEKILEIAKQYHIQLIIEDRPEIVKEYTKLGFLVLSPNREETQFYNE